MSISPKKPQSSKKKGTKKKTSVKKKIKTSMTSSDMLQPGGRGGVTGGSNMPGNRGC